MDSGLERSIDNRSVRPCNLSIREIGICTSLTDTELLLYCSGVVNAVHSNASTNYYVPSTSSRQPQRVEATFDDVRPIQMPWGESPWEAGRTRVWCQLCFVLYFSRICRHAAPCAGHLVFLIDMTYFYGSIEKTWSNRIMSNCKHYILWVLLGIDPHLPCSWTKERVLSTVLY